MIDITGNITLFAEELLCKLKAIVILTISSHSRILESDKVSILTHTYPYKPLRLK